MNMKKMWQCIAGFVMIGLTVLATSLHGQQRMNDGTILLTYGNRLNPKGIDVRFSNDEGATWSEPFRATGFLGDGGYPTSVQLPDGQILTAYYAQGIPGYNRYHMGVVIWDAEKTRGQGGKSE